MHVLVIGAYGSAGVAVAEGLAPAVGDAVDRLTLVDDGDPGGGLCILEGCMPSKDVLSAAAHRHEARVDGRLAGDPPGLDLDAVVDTKDDHVSDFAAHRRAAVHDLADREGIAFCHATARFRDDRAVDVDGETYRPDYVVIATGSTPNLPDLPGFDTVDHYTSADVLDARTLPESAVVMGFGYVGMELVPYLAEAGVDVTVIEHDERPLDEADPEFGDALSSLYREEFGVEIVTGAYEERVEPAGEGVRLHLRPAAAAADPDAVPDAVEAGGLFTFTGRNPNLDGLGLERTSLSPGPGWIDATMRPPDEERVFVVGDANGREPILHVAKEQGFLTAENLLRAERGEPLEPYENVHHRVVFSGASVYPFARVGHTPDSAREAGHEVATATRRAADDGVFRTKNVPRGLARLAVDAGDGTVLGYQGLHYQADTMAKTMQVLVGMGVDVRGVPDRAYHPTTPELLDGLFRDAAAEVGGG